MIKHGMAAAASSAVGVASRYRRARRSPVRGWPGALGAGMDLGALIMADSGGRCGRSSGGAGFFLDRSERQNNPGGAACRGR